MLTYTVKQTHRYTCKHNQENKYVKVLTGEITLQ